MKPAAESRKRSRTRAVLKSTVAAVCAGSIATTPVIGYAAAPPRAAAARANPTQVSIGAAEGFTHVAFSGPMGLKAKVRRDGQTVIVSLPKGAEPDIARLRVDPPAGVAGVDTRSGPDGFQIFITLETGADARFGTADGAVFVNLYEPKAAETTSPTDTAAAVPAGGVLKVEAVVQGPALTLKFPWRAPVASAVFRRGEAVWIVFDQRASLDMSAAPKSLGAVERVRWANGPDFTVVRIEAPPGVTVSAASEGPVWSVTLGAAPDKVEGGIKIDRDDQTGPPALTAALAGATKVVWISDPLVGDRFAVVTALGPVKPLDRARGFIELDLPATVQGLAIEPKASDLDIKIDGDLVRIERPRGLALSAPGVLALGAQTPEQLPQPAALPGLIDEAKWGELGEGGFLDRYRHLQDLAAAETAKGAEAPVTARLALARFLVGSDLGYEAIGVLDLSAKAHPALLNDAEFRGLRGAAKAMVGRYREAQGDLSAPVIAADPASALWRGYVASKLGHWADARQSFTAGARAVDLFSPTWRARFSAAHATAALQLNDLNAARSLVAFAEAQEGLAPYDQLTVSLVHARLFEADNQPERALNVYQAIARAPFGDLSTPAELRAAKIRYDKGIDAPGVTVKTLEGLKYRWRGDSTELEVIRTLGEIYLSQGLYRQALEALRSAGARMPDNPLALQLQSDLSAAFKNLFLNGQADGLEPLQALGLFYDFRDLTPVGAEGDEMVRKMVRRLVDVDLLPQAAEFMKWQVDNRLEGVAKAQVATDLASIYLMDRKPEQALEALWGSRTTLLPTALNAERRLLESRALMELNRYDGALEILGKDQSAGALDIRAEIYWRQKDWANAGAIYEKRLGDRFKTTATPLSGEEETRLIRAGVAYTLAGDVKGLARLSDRFGGFIDGARAPEALRISLAGLDGEGISPADFARVTAQADTFAAWVAGAKKRFREGRSAVAGAAAAVKSTGA